MPNIIDYAQNELASFAAKPFNAVDSLVLSQLAYINLATLVPGSTSKYRTVRLGSLLRAEDFDQMFSNVRAAKENLQLLYALAANPRFRDIELNYFVDERDPILEKQFAAVTYYLDNKTAYVAFRGTDTTLLGWKEDFNMAFQSPVPAQQRAVEYLLTIAEKWRGELLVGGHSKGGNLAIYAAVMSAPSMQNRIRRVYSHDGPGFNEEFFQSPGFARLAGRIEKTMPQSSLIGMLLENQESYTVVKSNRVGLMQHDPFSWIVAGDHFQILNKLTSGAQYMDRTLNEWLAKISYEEREFFIDALYSVLVSANINSVLNSSAEWQNNLPLLIDKVKNIDPTTRTFVLRALKALAAAALKNIPRQRPAGGK
jgi:hypothetical protein